MLKAEPVVVDAALAVAGVVPTRRELLASNPRTRRRLRRQGDGIWFGWEGATLFDRYAGTTELRKLIDGGATPEAVVASFARDEETWRRARARYLIYS